MSELRLEYYDGDIFAMAGGTPEHGMLAAGLIQRNGKNWDVLEARDGELVVLARPSLSFAVAEIYASLAPATGLQEER